MSPTVKDVAKRAGVSTSAVSRTFTDGASVSKKMRRKVEEAAAALGFQPNYLARSLTTRRTKLIGLISNNFHNPMFLQVFDRFTRSLQDQELRPLLVNLSGSTDAENSVRMLKQYSVDGVVVASSTLDPALALAFRETRIPVVHSFGRFSEDPVVNVVGIDNVACGKLVAKTLVERGYRKIAFLGGPVTATSTQDRSQGFESEARKHANVETSLSYAAAYTFEAGRTEMQRLISTGDLAEAYFCGDDVLSIGAMSALADSGLNVPEDVGIIGFNDMEMAAWDNIRLTTLRQPINEIVDASIELVISNVENPSRTPEGRLFACELIERDTLRPPG